MNRLHQAEAAAREATEKWAKALAKRQVLGGYPLEVTAAAELCAETQRDLLEALRAARGEAVAWRWPKGNWRDGEPSVYDIKELQLHALAPELAYAAPPAALVLRDREAFSRALAKAMRACLGEDYVREPFAFWMAVAGDVVDQLAAANKENTNG